MQFVAGLIAIGVMGLVAHLFFASISSFSNMVPYATLVTTVLAGAVSIQIWAAGESDQPSTREWAYLIVGAWMLAPLLFAWACWLGDIPLDQALALPQMLWQWPQHYQVNPASWAARLFGLSMFLGPGLSLVVLGSIVTWGVLSIGRSL
jgi:hypothetical protein